MNRREAWEELQRFCKYVEEWYPHAIQIELFGSTLWESNPGDIDVYVVGRKRTLNFTKSLFPNIHISRVKDKDRADYRKIWTRKDGLLVRRLPRVSRDDMMRHIVILRRELTEMRRELSSHKSNVDKHKDIYGYFGD